MLKYSFLLLSGLMEEKLKNPLVKTGLITMSGDLKHSIKENDGFLSEPLSQFESGEITMLLGHSESWLTNVAIEMSSLQDSNNLLRYFICRLNHNKISLLLKLSLHYFLSRCRLCWQYS